METPEKIEVDDRTRVTLTWSDRTVAFEARDLREACGCADCRSEPGKKRTAAVLSGPQTVTIDHAELRGAYAINFTFGPDGHSTGIFTWDMLRGLGDAVDGGQP